MLTETEVQPGHLTILGLGPGAWADVTIAARAILLAAPRITCRTLRHPTVAALRQMRPDVELASFDAFYEAAEGWETLYAAIVDQVATAAATTGVIYAVPGHPLIGETTVRLLRERAASQHLTVHLVAGLSFLEPICTALNLDPMAQGLQWIDATDLAAWQPQQVAGTIITGRPTLVSQVYNRRMAGAAKLALLEVFPPAHLVTLIQAAGLPEERQQTVPLSELDHDEFPDHLTSLFVPAIPPETLQVVRTPEALRYVVARLRAPDGCPWDREQSHASLLPYVLEEAAEVADAIDAYDADPDHLAEELGDLLLQVYLHTEIAQEEETFAIGDVFEHITRKLIRRHPHVFGTVAVGGPAQVVQNWEAIKQAERAAQGTPHFESRLKTTPQHLAALAAAHQIQRRAVKAGFDWPTVADWLGKVAEEWEELRQAPDDAARTEELGDLLFTLVALARRWGIDAEAALRGANAKFTRRFHHMERAAQARGLVFEELDRAAQLALWRAAKADEAAATPDSGQ